MPSTYSPSLRIELPGSGEQSGVWGTTTNNNLGTLLEQSIAGVQAITMADANYTLSNYNGVSDEARKAVLVVSGINAAVRDIIAPLVPKVYTIKNNTTGGFAINIRAPSGLSVSIPNGVTSSVYCDGTDFNLALTQASVAAGTGISVGVIGTTNTISFGPITSAQLAAAVSDETGSGAAVFATSPTLVTPNLGTPSTLVGTNITGTASGLTAGNVTTNANLTGDVTSVGNATTLSNTAVTPGSYSAANITVDSKGRITAAATGSAGGGTVTNVSGTLPISVASGTSTPVVSIALATASVSGYLSSTDWTAFNSKYSTGGALGTPSSGDLSNCSFPTLNQNTTGTAAYATNATNATNQSGGTVNATTITGSSDATINGLTVGKGGGNISGNTAVGYQALSSNSSANNTAVGYGANSANGGGNNNTTIGYSTQTSTTGSNYEIVIGSTAQGFGSFYVTIGSSGSYIYNHYNTNATWTRVSDERLKTNIQPAGIGLSFINRLNIKTYNWRPSYDIPKELNSYSEENTQDTDTVMYGMLAQDVKAALDVENIEHFAGWDVNPKDGTQAVSMEMFVLPLINAIKELTARLEALENKNNGN